MKKVASVVTTVAMLATVFVAFPVSQAQAADTSFLSPTSTRAPEEWASETNAFSSNNVYALARDGSGEDEQGYDDFNFSIPSGSTINGIEVSVEAKAEKANDCKIKVSIPSNTGSDTFAATVTSTSDTSYSFGGSTNLWSDTWTDTNFSNANFSLKLEVDDVSGSSCSSDGTEDILVDHVQVKVYYTEGFVETPDDDQYLAITCDNVQISGNTWTMSGTWKAYNFPGQDDQYDVAVFSPLATLKDENSGDVPDTFATTQGPSNYVGANPNKDDMEGTWTNTETFVSAPSYIGAALYHAAVPGNEQSGDATCSFTIPDTTAPTVTIEEAAAQADPTDVSPILFDVLFSEIVTGFLGSDISFAGSTAGGSLAALVSGSGTTYTVSVSGMTSTGTVVASIPAGAAQDGSSNLSGASSSTDNSVLFQVDVCLNIAEVQTTVPAGYESLSAGQCTVIPQCRDGVDNADAEDSLADANDPGCWTNPNDSETYNSNDTDETTPADVCPNDSGIQTSSEQCTPDACTNIDGFQASVPAGSETLSPGICTVIPQCRDGVDNTDSEDSLADANDPGCWTNPNDSETYNSNDTDESDVADVCPNDAGIQTSSEQCTPDVCTNIAEFQGDIPEGYESLEAGQCTVIPQCRDGVDNDEDGTTDFGAEGDLGCASPDDPNESDDPLVCEVGSHLETVQDEPVAPTCPEGYAYDSETNSCETILVEESFFFEAFSTEVEEGPVPEEETPVVEEETPVVEEETPVVEEEVPAVEEETPATEETPEPVVEEVSVLEGEQFFSTVVIDEPTPYCPEGLILNGDTDMCEGESYEICVADPEPTDVCANIDGVQTEKPSGKQIVNGDQCIDQGRSGGSSRPGNTGGQVLGASTECSALLDDFLFIGWDNDEEEVKKLQDFLNMNLGIALTVSGLFGPETLAAVKQFQVKYATEVLTPWVGLPGSGIDNGNDPTGFVYQTTRWQINNLFCPGSEAFPSTLI